MQIMQDRSRLDNPTDNSNQHLTKNRVRGRAFWITITLAIAAVVVGVAVLQARFHKPTRDVPELAPPRSSAATISAPSPAELSISFREVAKTIKPAVVYISVDNDESSTLRSQRPEAAGSGFIVTPDGYIMTNNHVVGGARRINVTLADGRRFEAKIIGTDNDTDLAVIKIDSDTLPVAVLGDSDIVQQGDWVLALGSPFGLQQTLTAGIVSATGREVGDSQFNRYIQTDAAINPGNSGGPLVNMQGEVVGINTLIVTRGSFSMGNVGIGFAINSNVVRQVFYQLAREGKVTRGYLGVFVLPLSEEAASRVGLEPNTGVFVRDVTDPNSPAAKAGLQASDVITAFDGKQVKAPRELTDAVAATPVGKTVQVDYVRSGEPHSVTVEIAERPNQPIARRAPSDLDIPPGLPGEGESEEGARQGRLGIQGQTITPETAERMKIKAKDGVLVITVGPATPASEAGILHGDVIHAVGKTRVRTTEELVEALKAVPAGDEVLLEIERGGRTIVLTVNLD